VIDLLVGQGLAQKVISCESGAEFLTVATGRLLQGLPIKVALLDIIVEPSVGIATAVAVRAFEKALKVTQPIPILFLSAVPFDSSLKTALGQNQPALYLNKGSDAVPEKIGAWLARVIEYLLQWERG